MCASWCSLPRLCCYCSAETDKTLQVSAGNMKRALYLVFGNMCPDTTRDTRCLDRQNDGRNGHTGYTEMENETWQREPVPF